MTLRWRLAALLVVCVAFAVGRQYRQLPIPKITVQWANSAQDLSTDGRLDSGEELLLVYVGSPWCAWSTHDDTRTHLVDAVMKVRAQADSLGMDFHTVGVAPTWDPRAGWKHLDELFRFEEVVLGRNWMNPGVIDFVWSDESARVATPQLVVVRRSVVAPSEGTRASVGASTVLVRAVGLDGLEEWTESGASLEWRPRRDIRESTSALIAR